MSDQSKKKNKGMQDKACLGGYSVGQVRKVYDFSATGFPRRTIYGKIVRLLETRNFGFAVVECQEENCPEKPHNHLANIG